MVSTFFLLITLTNRQARAKLQSLPLTLFDISGGLLITALPLLFEPAKLIWARTTSIQDFRASPYKIEEIIGFGLHLVGLRSGLGWTGISAPEEFILFFLVSAILATSIFLLVRVLSRNIFSSCIWDGRSQVVVYLSVLAVTYVGLQFIFAFQRLSYPWIKTMDYFNYLPCLILGLGAEWLAGHRAGLRRALTAVALLLFTSVYIKASIPAKNQIFSFYQSNVLAAPPLAAFVYTIPVGVAIAGIKPAQNGFSLELFYYMNRWRGVPLEVHMADKVGSWASYRYLQETSLIPRTSHRFCLEQKWNVPAIQKNCENITEGALSPVGE